MATRRGYGAHQRPVALCAWAGQHEQKDIAGRRILDQPGRAILIDLMVTLSGPLFTRNEKRFFSSSGAAAIQKISTTPRWLIGFCGAPRIHAC
jgi:hypothetical protein